MPLIALTAATALTLLASEPVSGPSPTTDAAPERPLAPGAAPPPQEVSGLDVVVWDESVGGSGHAYLLITGQNITWDAARQGAEALTFQGVPGYLATPTSAAENDFLVSVYSSGSESTAWIGASDVDQEGEWTWVTGPETGTQFSVGVLATPPFNYANWGGIEPNNFAGNEDHGCWVLGPLSGLAAGEWADANSAGTNAAIAGYLVEFGPFPIQDVGAALSGGAGEPALTGSGSLQGGSLVTLDLSGAIDAAPLYLVAGLSSLFLPFKGGTLVPDPVLILGGLTTDAAGAFTTTFPWPLGLPAGTEVYAQAWIVDAAGPVGFAASNGLQLTTP